MEKTFATKKSSAEAGFSLFELAAVLAIVGAVIAGVWVTMGAVGKTKKDGQLQQQIEQVVANIRTIYRSRSYMAAANITGTLKDSGVFPSEMVSGADVQHAYGSTMEVRGYGVGHQTFDVIIYDMPPDACVRLMNYVFPKQTELGLSYVEVDAQDTGMLLEDAVRYCSESAFVGAIYMSFYFRG